MLDAHALDQSRRRTEKRGLNAVVLGAGPVGLLGALALLVRGFDTWIYSRESATSPRAAWVESVGARYIESAKLPVGNLGKQVGQRRPDPRGDRLGQRWPSRPCPRSARTACMIFTGVPGRKSDVTIDAERIMRNLVLENQLIYGTVNAGPPAFDARHPRPGEVQRPLAEAGARAHHRAVPARERSATCCRRARTRSRA